MAGSHEDPSQSLTENERLYAAAGRLDNHTNITFAAIPPDILNQLFEQNSFDKVTDCILIVAFALLITVGAVGNGLVCYVVVANPSMRIPRNAFIFNLALSDLILCLFTQPLNLMKLRYQAWSMGEVMCKLIPMLQGTNVFVSTMSITSIALDRLHMIVYPTKPKLCKIGIIFILALTWVISATMATPLLLFYRIATVQGSDRVHTLCVENDSLRQERVGYSLAALVFQYIMPMTMLSFAHARICKKLHKRRVMRRHSMPTGGTGSTVQSPFLERKRALERRRKRKTNLLLVMIAVVFAISWLPLNIFNIFLDLNEQLFRQINTSQLVFPICHLLVLCSACANPVLYGWLNDKFHKEFVKIFFCFKNVRCGRGSDDRITSTANGLEGERTAHNPLGLPAISSVKSTFQG